MSVYEKIKTLDTEEFQRHVEICQEIFLALLTKVSSYILSQQEYQPMKKRGRKSSVSLADQLLLTLTYMRHYPTFAKLGLEFSISESYANKIYHRILDILVKVTKHKNRKELLASDLQAVAIDVTEQPIERPKKNQRDYYSGKKKLIPLKLS